jgi:DNA polymerase/3'-5' exonuclease PolX
VKIETAKKIADSYVAVLRPSCDQIEIAGSIRRRRPEVKDIEIVCIPSIRMGGLFNDQPERIPSWYAFFDEVADNTWAIVKGNARGKYMQIDLTPYGIKIDLFTATPENWGLIYAIRTGSAAYSHKVLATGWVRNGYKSVDGMLTWDGESVPTPFEKDLFRCAGVAWVDPSKREV